MKKRLLAVLMAVCMMATVVSGCGKEEATNQDEVESYVEESKVDAETPSSEAEAEESTEEAVEESAEEVVEESTEESSEAADVVDADGKDWSTAYDDYFERDDIMGDNIKCVATSMAEGMSFDVTVATAGENMWMGYDFGTVAFDMYADAEKIYACTVMEGEETWIWAPIAAEEDVEGITDMADTALVETDNIESCTYREAILDDGIVYDVLDVEVNDGEAAGTAVYFVNRETQKVERCVMEQDDMTVVCLLEEIDGIEIPAEAANATEATMDDVLGAMIGAIFMGASTYME